MEIKNAENDRREVIQLVFEDLNELDDFIDQFVAFQEFVGIEHNESANNIINTIEIYARREKNKRIVAPIFEDMCYDLMKTILKAVQQCNKLQTDYYKKIREL